MDLRSLTILASIALCVSSVAAEPPADKPAPAPPALPAPSAPGKNGVEIVVLPASDVQAKLGDDASVKQIGFVPGYTLRFLLPFKWKAEDPSHPLRLVQIRISPGANAALGDGVLTISGGIGGSVEDNIARWVAQFSEIEGQATQQDLQVLGTPLLVTEVIATGTLNTATPGGAPDLKPNWTLYGAIVQGVPEGTLFIKAIGPMETMKERRGAWEMFVRNLRIVERPKHVSPPPDHLDRPLPPPPPAKEAEKPKAP